MSHFYKIFCYSCQEYGILGDISKFLVLPSPHSKNLNTESVQEISLKNISKEMS